MKTSSLLFSAASAALFLASPAAAAGTDCEGKTMVSFRMTELYLMESYALLYKYDVRIILVLISLLPLCVCV